MHNNEFVDYYELLQISQNADAETIQRVYRLLARRYHPDNQESGDAQQFRQVHEAYSVLSDPDARIAYDVKYQAQKGERWRLISSGSPTDSDFSREQAIRFGILELLFTRRRLEPNSPGLFPNELEKFTGTPKEHLEFTLWYLIQKKLVQRSDSSHLVITAEGVDYLEQRAQAAVQFPRRLRAAGER